MKFIKSACSNLRSFQTVQDYSLYTSEKKHTKNFVLHRGNI